MFLPKFEITNRLLNYLIKIEVDLNIIKNVEIASEWQSRLKKEAQIKRVISAMRFVEVEMKGETVQKVLADDPGRDESVADIAMRLEIIAKESDLQVLINWMNANKLVEQIIYLSTKFKHEDIGEKELIQINRLLGERLVRSEVLGGKRTDSFVEGSTLHHPKAHEMPYQMEDLLTWNRSATKEVIHPILRSIILFYELLRIRPFLHNNTLTITHFWQLFLGSQGYDFVYSSLEEELFKNKQKLFETAEKIGESGGMEELMELVIGGVAAACEKTRMRIMSITGESLRYKTESGRAVALTERQVALMEELTTQNQLTIKELRQVLPLVSDDTILRDLKDLVAKKMIRKKGKTKGAVYVLGKVKNF